MADVAGFTRLMAADEEGTTARVVDMFGSVVEAFDCGRRIQEEIAKDQETLPLDERIALRIGLHLGDVIEEGGVGRRVRVHTLAAEALGGEPSAGRQIVVDDADTARRAMRSAAEMVAHHARERAREARQQSGRDHSRRRPTKQPQGIVRATFGVGNLIVVATGLLVVAPQIGAATPSGLWMLVGGALTGLGVGMMKADAPGRRAWMGIGIALGLAVGAWWLGNAVIRAAAWVTAAGMLGSGIEALRRGRSADS